MKALRSTWPFIVLSLALLAGSLETSSCFAMGPSASYPAQVETIFLPQSKDEVYSRLRAFLGSAKKQILIAMYWLTDEFIINKLIELKKRDIDIQIIFDESTPDSDGIIEALITSNIIPIVSPKLLGGVMHNKFVVIDNAAVWTGSANFTKINLAPVGDKSNNENIAIISSPVIAKQYNEAFSSIERTIIKFYIKTIAKEDSRILPAWLIPLCKELNQSNEQFNDSLNAMLPTFSAAQEEKLRSLFLKRHPFAREEEATPKQKAFLQRYGHNPNISKREATELIGEIIAAERYGY